MKSWLFLAWSETCDLLTPLDIKFELKYDLFEDVYFVENDDFNVHHLIKELLADKWKNRNSEHGLNLFIKENQ